MKNGLIVDKYGNKFWYKDYKFHRENGPTIEWSDGSKEWYKDGKWHRIDGPAVEYTNGNKRWYYEGEYIDCESQKEFERIINLQMFW